MEKKNPNQTRMTKPTKQKALVSVYLSIRIRAVGKQSGSLAELCGLEAVQAIHPLQPALFQLCVVPPAQLYLHNF